MSIKIEMPKLSDTMTEGTLLRWRKKIGDSVEVGDVIAEVETDKASMEMEAFDDGTLLEILTPEGSRVPVGTCIGILGSENESIPEQTSNPQTPAAQATEKAVSPVKPEIEISLPDTNTRIKSSPLARKIATEKGVNLANLIGSGPGGRIVRKDVEAACSSTPESSAVKPTSKPAIRPVIQETDNVTPLTTMRRVIADRLLTSKTTIPHFYLTVDVDVEQLTTLRNQINIQAEKTHNNKFTINDFVMKALIRACRLVPNVNASFNEDSIVKFNRIGLSVAIAVDDGLVTPVIKKADSKSLLELSREVKDFAARAKEKKLKPDEFDGGTITISNLGAYGIEQFSAIVNPPQAAILAVGSIMEKPVVVSNQIVIRKQMTLTLSCDHRVVDGAEGAKFLKEIKTLLENPALILI